MGKVKPIQSTAVATAWYEKNRAKIDKKRDKYLDKWDRMAPHDKAQLTLHSEDGI